MLSTGSAIATAVQDVFSTPCLPVQNKVSSEPNHIPVVTPPDNIPSNTVRTPVGDDKGDNSNEHNKYIDISSTDGTVNESRDTIDNDGNECWISNNNTLDIPCTSTRKMHAGHCLNLTSQ